MKTTLTTPGLVIFILGVSSLTFAQGTQLQAPVLDFADMVEFPAGSFKMGFPQTAASPYGDVWFVDQLPQHDVNLPDFRLDKQEVTVKEFALFLTNGGASHHHENQPIERVRDGFLPVKGSDNQPMRQVTWQAAADYCSWAGKRLPTEAEWERAAAGMETREYPWGQTGAGCQFGNYFAHDFCHTGPVDVGSHPGGRTPEGIDDMGGNVAEWTADWYGPYTAEGKTSPKGPATGKYRVVRGGGFLDFFYSLRTRARVAAPPTGRSENIGFRCAWSDEVQSTLVRGPLTLPDDAGRQASPFPYAQPFTRPEVLISGLQKPGAMVALKNRWFLAEAGTGRVLQIDPQSMAMKPVIDGLSEVIRLATDGNHLFVADNGSGRILRLAPDGSPEVVATGENGPGVIAGDAGEVYWAAGAALRVVRRAGGPVEQLATGVNSVSDLDLTSSHLYITSTTAPNNTEPRIVRISRRGGFLQKIADAKTWGTNQGRPLQVTQILVDEAAGKIFVGLVQIPFSNATRICELPSLLGGSMKCLTHSPIRVVQMVQNGGFLYWLSGNTIARLDRGGNQPYENRAIWVQAAGFLVDDRQVVWADSLTGQLRRVLH